MCRSHSMSHSLLVWGLVLGDGGVGTPVTLRVLVVAAAAVAVGGTYSRKYHTPLAGTV